MRAKKRFFHDAFVYAHRTVIAHILMGAECVDGKSVDVDVYVCV